VCARGGGEEGDSRLSACHQPKLSSGRSGVQQSVVAWVCSACALHHLTPQPTFLENVIHDKRLCSNHISRRPARLRCVRRRRRLTSNKQLRQLLSRHHPTHPPLPLPPTQTHCRTFTPHLYCFCYLASLCCAAAAWCAPLFNV